MVRRKVRPDQRPARPEVCSEVCEAFSIADQLRLEVPSAGPQPCFESGKLERPAKITLARGERQRDRVLTDLEWQQYIAECPQPWRDAAIVVRGTGMRPGEVFCLRWENIYLDDSGSLIQVTDGKTKTARRMLPMLPVVHDAIKARHIGAGILRRAGSFRQDRERATSTRTRRKINTRRPFKGPMQRRRRTGPRASCPSSLISFVTPL